MEFDSFFELAACCDGLDWFAAFEGEPGFGLEFGLDAGVGFALAESPGFIAGSDFAIAFDCESFALSGFGFVDAD